jgi:DNA-binding NarL/FixJ family response regulator
VPPVRVVAIDDHPIVLKGIRHSVIDAEGDLEFVGVLESLTDGAELPEADVALLDLRLRDGSRPRDNVTALLARGIQVLVFTAGGDIPQMSDAVMAGALGIVLKHQTEDQLIEAIHTVAEGSTFLSQELAEVLHESSALRPHLSEREIEVLDALNQGLVTKQAARRLDVSESTIKEHLTRIRK